ncbi:MAG: DUF4342 domain-containing protein [Clostridiales bacterium]|nr:DUF4342 domain-containing protein [Clostridiales bacterium]
MEITLEKIELVKDRTGVSYKEAKEALEAADGSVVDAIIEIEESIGAKTKGRAGESGYKVIEKVKELIKKGNVSKIVIRKDDEIVLNLPVNIGIFGTVIAPIPVVLGVLMAFGTRCVIEIVKDDGSIIDVSEMANETFEDVVEKGSVIADELKSKGTDVYNSVKSKTSEALSKVNQGKDADFCCDHDAEDSDNDNFEEGKDEKNE